MSQPLLFYNSSHNTYLEGDQLTGKSTVNMVRSNSQGYYNYELT